MEFMNDELNNFEQQEKALNEKLDKLALRLEAIKQDTIEADKEIAQMQKQNTTNH